MPQPEDVRIDIFIGVLKGDLCLHAEGRDYNDVIIAVSDFDDD